MILGGTILKCDCGSSVSPGVSSGSFCLFWYSEGTGESEEGMGQLRIAKPDLPPDLTKRHL